MTTGVVFDFGGVMTASPKPLKLMALVDELGLEWRPFDEGFGKYRNRYDQGTMTIGEMYDLILGEAGIRVDTETRTRIEAADTESWLSRNPETLEWMRELKAAGFKIGILTNMSPLFAPIFKSEYADYVTLADALVISGEEKLVKPMKEIYELLQRRIGLKPEELCFVDDLDANCEAARACGWQAIRFESVAKARAQLKGLGTK